MKAELLIDQRYSLGPRQFIEIVVWRLPEPLRGSAHRFKYRLAMVTEGVCVLRYDNEAGKGDHRHIGEREQPYAFNGLESLLDDFWAAVETWRQQ